MTSKARLVLLVPVFLVLVSGCQKGNPNALAKLSGKVTYKGAPVTGGNLMLTAKKGGAINSIIISPDGTYSLTDLPEGEMTVTIETESIKESGAEEYGGKKMPTSPQPKGANIVKGKYVKIPDKYNNINTSGLSVTLTAGDNTKDFDLTD